MIRLATFQYLRPHWVIILRATVHRIARRVYNTLRLGAASGRMGQYHDDTFVFFPNRKHHIPVKSKVVCFPPLPGIHVRVVYEYDFIRSSTSHLSSDRFISNVPFPCQFFSPLPSSVLSNHGFVSILPFSTHHIWYKHI